jgi:hypothetical protein
MSAKREECVVVCMYENSGFTKANYFQVREACIDAQSDYWGYINPGTFLVFFLQQKNGCNRRNNLISRMKYLKNNSSIHATIGYGSSLGKVIVSFSVTEKIKSSPLGMAENDVVDMARQNSSLAVATSPVAT